MAKPFTPRLVRVSEEAMKNIPEALQKNLQNNMAYTVMPENDGKAIISDMPDATGRICAFVPVDATENMVKATAKSPKINVSIEMPDGTQKLMTVSVPENVMDEDIQYIIQIAANCVRETKPAASNGGDVMFDYMLEHLNNFTPLAVDAMVTDLDVKLN